MIIDTRTTDELEHITSNLCKDNKETMIVTNALKEALAVYQWEYQKATNRQKRDVSDQLYNALEVVKEHLKFLGQNTLIEDIEEAFEDSDAGLVKSNILTLAKRHMKNCCINAKETVPVVGKMPKNHKWEFRPIGIDSNRYDDSLAKSINKAFVEWCEQYPLDKAPDHFDRNFEPLIY